MPKLFAQSKEYKFIFMLLPAAAIIWILSFFFESSSQAAQQGLFLFKPLTFLQENIFVSISITFLTILVQAFFLIRINTKYTLLETRSYLPGIIYILLAGSFVGLQKFTSMLISNTFIIIAFDFIFPNYKKENAMENIYLSGLFISLGSLFNFNALFFFPIVFVSIIILRTPGWREWVVALLGAVTPYFYLFTYYFVFETKFETMFYEIKNFYLTQTEALHISINSAIYWFAIALLIVASGIFLFAKYNTKKISTRKYKVILLWFMPLSLISYSVSPSFSAEAFFPVFVTLSFMFSNYLLNVSQKVLKILFASLLITVSIFYRILG